MFYEIVLMLENYNLILNYLFNCVLFVGGLYAAIHNRELPSWLITCLWYIGASALLVNFTITAEVLYGQLFMLSHFRIGVIPEILLKLALTVTVLLLFIKTVIQDILWSRKRNNSN